MALGPRSAQTAAITLLLRKAKDSDEHALDELTFASTVMRHVLVDHARRRRARRRPQRGLARGGPDGLRQIGRRPSRDRSLCHVRWTCLGCRQAAETLHSSKRKAAGFFHPARKVFEIEMLRSNRFFRGRLRLR